ncbi:MULTISPECIES: PTS sugar transporter subunit IIA [unclassified Lactobacillus]|uniref:PTS sugar transporter subunit IIA n=1 Tax=unclassified Lactobacillus TaxID=2620435 RepID=UPI000EFC29FB|nr:MULTISPECIES: fructose PTS transporter subunit IIA [unclassified Lactobacillus]RMC24918.1 PTS sugar transporter subunit IIA [Lactobacillus sp. ESL0247]RMC29073.1 PTS sugar transporter subunit IIA [Lactobacillus sp. ESL0246]RMC32676.1 PTS sugar transporter subunit IIA [Lactobacillus sp. ESL0245]
MKFIKKNVLLNVDVKDKDSLLKYVSDQAQKISLTDDPDSLLQSFQEREKEYSTGLQDGFAIPHAKSDAVKKVGIIYVRLSNPIKWKTYDNKPVTDVFALMVPPENAGNAHLKMLANLSTALLEDGFKVDLRQKSNEEEIAKFISKEIGANEL